MKRNVQNFILDVIKKKLVKSIVSLVQETYLSI